MKFYLIEWQNKHFIIMDIDEKKSSVPEDENNEDYKRYLKWLEKGNEPEIISLGSEEV